MNVLNAQNLTAGYGDGIILHDLSFSVAKGEFLGIAGPNGAGKSTLLKLLARLMRPISGTITLKGRSLLSYPRRLLAQHLAVILQDFTCPYEFTAFDMVAMGRNPFLSRWRSLSAHDRTVIANALTMTDIAHLRDRSFLELSAGERQRVIIAKALAQQPSILLLDEPSTHLDLHHQVSIFTILHRLSREEHLTVICITHDLTLAAQYMDRLLLLKEGRLLAHGSPPQILRKNVIEDLFRVSVCVGIMPETNAPYVYPVGVLEN